MNFTPSYRIFNLAQSGSVAPYRILEKAKSNTWSTLMEEAIERGLFTSEGTYFIQDLSDCGNAAFVTVKSRTSLVVA